MNLEWISQKSSSLMGIAVGLGFIAFAFLFSQYMYIHLCVAVVALVYAYKQFKKRATPFEKREREIRRKVM